MRDSIIHLHTVHEREHVRPLTCIQGLLVLAEDVGQLLQGQAQLARVDELGDQRDVLARQPVVQPNQETMQEAGDLFVGDAIHGGIVSHEAH